MLLEVRTGRSSASGWSHSCDTPTRQSANPSAADRSVPEGMRLAMRRFTVEIELLRDPPEPRGRTTTQIDLRVDHRDHVGKHEVRADDRGLEVVRAPGGVDPLAVPEHVPRTERW